MKARILFFSLIAALISGSTTLFGQTYKLSGSIYDKETGEPLTGAGIRLLGTPQYALSGLDGSYEIRNIAPGHYTVEISYISYNKVTQALTIESDQKLNRRLSSQGTDLEAVQITASKDESTESSARLTEKNSMNVVNAISAKEIEVSPDITVANVVQRVSGVSLERNANGDGQHAIVRGMDKRYNYTLVNGIKIPSPDPRNRYVPLDIFPSDLLDRLEVTKALTPNMEGDAIGGVIDMKMKNAPERFTVNANLGTGYSQMYFDESYRTFDRSRTQMHSPRITNGNNYLAKNENFQLNNVDFKNSRPLPNQVIGLSIGNRFFNNKLGVLLAGSYQNTYRGANSMFMTTFVDQSTNTPYYEIVQTRKFSAQQVRSGAHLKLDYRFNPRHKLDLYASAIALNDFETRTRTDTILKIGRGQGPGTGRIELRERSRQRYQKIYNATLQGSHELVKHLRASWSAVYSLATNDDPDMAEIQWITAVVKDNQGNYVQDPIQYSTDYTRRWSNNKDQDLAGYLNLAYSPTILGIPFEFSAGGMFRDKSRSSNFDQYSFRAFPIIQNWSGSIHDGSWQLFNQIGTPTHPLNYRCNESVFAQYGMIKANLRKLEVLGGVRLESTAFSWESDAPITVKGKIGSITYQDILPSLHFKYKPSLKQNIRASYFSSISRPNFYEVIPYSINEEDFRERGNPFLSRTSANNFDLRYEHFNNFLDKFMLGLFYKKISDPIESALVIDGQTVFLQPSNFGDARNLGLEFDFTRYIRKFGIRVFYTFTQSEITTSKIVRFRDGDGNLTSRQENQTRPLQGQSKHISNVSLLYKNVKSKTEVQLALVYTGKRIISVSPYLDNDIWQRGFLQMDLSVEQGIGKHFIVYAKVNNILNTALRADIFLKNTFNPEQAPYLDAANSVLVREDFYKQIYFLGIKYKFSQGNKKSNQ
jgi:outer membrane cobalamin receptor